MGDGYDAYVAGKRRIQGAVGFEPPSPHPSLYEHQAVIVAWACRMGRCAIFADTGLGKTRMQLEWARAVAAHTGRPVLLLAPLAVGDQTIAEALTIGVAAAWAEDGDLRHADIHVLNYDRMHRVDVGRYAGVVLDESSILKAVDGKTRHALTAAFSGTPYRLCCTATPAPNDHTELGNHAEFLGVCTREEMLAEYFVHDGGSTASWRLKGHAKSDFWRWMASWAVMIRKPSDLGFTDGAYDLPPLDVRTEMVRHEAEPAPGMLFAMPAASLTDQRTVRRDSLESRCRAVADLAAREPDEPWLVWCELNDESALLASLIPGAVEVTGSMDQEAKRAALLGFADGSVPVLVTKPKIAGFGMNWQRCARMAFVGLSHSYEQWYQAVRRCWRFGQSRPVHVYMVQTTADGHIARSLRRKADAADEMAVEMAAQVRDHQMAAVIGRRPGVMMEPGEPMRIPEWLGGTV